MPLRFYKKCEFKRNTVLNTNTPVFVLAIKVESMSRKNLHTNPNWTPLIDLTIGGVRREKRVKWPHMITWQNVWFTILWIQHVRYTGHNTILPSCLYKQSRLKVCQGKTCTLLILTEHLQESWNHVKCRTTQDHVTTHCHVTAHLR